LDLFVGNIVKKFLHFSFENLSVLRKEVKNARDRASAREKQTHGEGNVPGDDKTARIQKSADTVEKKYVMSNKIKINGE
jgi:hypothetical protein